jgi:hypothetical protein
VSGEFSVARRDMIVYELLDGSLDALRFSASTKSMAPRRRLLDEEW